MEPIANSVASLDHQISPPVSILKKPMPGMMKMVHLIAITALGIGGALIGAGVVGMAFVAIPLAVGGLIGAALAVGLFATAYLAYKFVKKFFSARSVKFSKNATILSDNKNTCHKIRTDFTERVSSKEQIPIQRGGRGKSRCKQFIRCEEDKDALIVQLEAKNQTWREGNSSSGSERCGFTDKELKEAWEAESKSQADFTYRLNRIKNYAAKENHTLYQLELFEEKFYYFEEIRDDQEIKLFKKVFDQIEKSIPESTNIKQIPIDQFIKDNFNFNKSVDLLYGKKATVKEEAFSSAKKSDQEAIFDLISKEFSEVKLEDLEYDQFNSLRDECLKKAKAMVAESEEAINQLDEAIKTRSDSEKILDGQITQLIEEHVKIVTNEQGVKSLTLIPQKAIDELKTKPAGTGEIDEMISNYSNAKLDELNKWLKERINPSKNIFYADELEKLKSDQSKQKFDTYNNTIFIHVCESRLYQPEKIMTQLDSMFKILDKIREQKVRSKFRRTLDDLANLFGLSCDQNS